MQREKGRKLKAAEVLKDPNADYFHPHTMRSERAKLEQLEQVLSEGLKATEVNLTYTYIGKFRPIDFFNYHRKHNVNFVATVGV